MTKATEKPKPEGRRRGAVDLAALVSPLSSRAMKRYGFTHAALLERWPEIAGERLAEVSLPLGLSFAPGNRTGGTLTLRVEGPMATQLQHGADLVIERVNRYFGYAAVARLKLVQGPVPPRRAHRPAAPKRAGPPHPEVEALPEGPLKEALLQLAATFPVDKDGQ
jgi:hypothetical protein